MKKLIVLLALVAGAYTVTPKEVYFENKDLEMSGVKVLYKEKLFTGTVLKEVKLLKQTVSIECVEGKAQEFPTIVSKENVKIYKIPKLNKGIKINKEGESPLKMVSIVIY